MGGGASNNSRLIFAGGQTPTKVNTLDHVTIASTGNATDYGDLSVIKAGVGNGACGDSHGGLQG